MSSPMAQRRRKSAVFIQRRKRYSQLTVCWASFSFLRFRLIRIAGIDITADRLFGPQPRTATFVCVWMIHLGPIKALLSAYDGQILQAALRALPFNFTDSPNAPASQYSIPLDPDGKSSKIVDTWAHVDTMKLPSSKSFSMPSM
jgi:hypothetical protein